MPSETKQIEDGGPAFPTENERQTGVNSYHFTGMSIRDYFAAQALCGILASRVVEDSSKHADTAGERVADAAYGWADYMLAARKAAPDA